MAVVDIDFVGELLGSRERAELASRIYRLGDSLRTKLMSEPVKPTHANFALIFFFARSFKTYQAAITLVQTGFWQDAAVLARVLREADYQVRWVQRGGEKVAELFIRDYERNQRRLIRTLAEIAVPEIQVQAAAIAENTEVNEELDEWWRNWWSKDRKEHIGWLAKEVGYADAQRLEYGTLSAFVHSSPALFNHYFRDSEKGGMTLETRPGIDPESLSFADAVLWSIFSAFLDVCRLFASDRGYDFSNELSEIDDRMQLVVSQTEQPRTKMENDA
jgi:hypothetical protein